MKYTTLLALAAVGLFYSSQALLASSVDDVNKQVNLALPKSAQVQSEIDQLHTEQNVLDQEFLTLTRQLEGIESYNRSLAVKINQLQQSSQSLSLQFDWVANIDREIKPLIEQMHHSLEAFVAADIPFLKEHRTNQIRRLGEDIVSPVFNISVKYQKLLAAFVEEDQYAQQMQSYPGSVKIDDLETQVNFLRLGRVAWYYQRLDGSRSSRWDKEHGGWIKLDDESNAQLKVAINMATDIGVPKLVDFNLGSISQ